MPIYNRYITTSSAYFTPASLRPDRNRDKMVSYPIPPLIVTNHHPPHGILFIRIIVAVMKKKEKEKVEVEKRHRLIAPTPTLAPAHMCNPSA